MQLKYPNLFKPITIGNVTFKNRIFSAPISSIKISPEQTLTQENIAFFELRAKGGAATTTLGSANVVSSGSGHVQEIVLDNPAITFSLAHLSRSIKRHDSVPCIEFTHAGKYAGVPNLENPTPINKAYGPIDETINGTRVYQMNEQMLKDLAADYGKAAALAKKTGFEMINVHAGHGWLISQFLSPTNTRTDKYGGSFENRMRFPIMILESIREAVGPGFPLELRMNALEFYEQGHGLDEGIRIAKALQDYVEIIHVTVGNQEVPETYVRTHPDMFLPHGVNVELAAEIKKNVDIPVAVVGALTDPDKCEEIIRSGKADFVVMARALMADPFFPKKAKAGHDEDIVKCMRCFTCFDTALATRDTVCALNPVIGEEELYFSPPALPKKIKKVLVAGAGPGGMKAALTAAERGHKVTLCEASTHLGGQILYEKNVDFKKNYYEYAQCLIRQVEKNKNIEIKLNTKVDADFIEKTNPDALICAIGAKPIIPSIPGIDNENVVFCTELAKETPKIGNKVVIIGAGLVGTESAVHFLRENKDVTLIEARDDFAIDAPLFHKIGLAIELRKYDSQFDLMLNTKVKAVTNEGVVAISKDGDELTIPAETVFCAVGMQSRSSEVEALSQSIIEFRAIGDCVRPGKAKTAIHHGYYAGLDL